MATSTSPAWTVTPSTDASSVEATCKKYGLAVDEFHELRRRCVASKATAYCPYSRFRVGASVISVDNAYFDGANVENASYPVGTCAERVAIAKAVTEGHRKLRAVAVATDIAPPASPCGMCRQLYVASPTEERTSSRLMR